MAKKFPNLKPTNEAVAFVDVNVVPMDEERILENQTVIVRDKIIENIGNSKEVDVPDTALIVEGDGKYLMPGLVDMHVHIMNGNDLLLFVANGVTAVRNMWGYTGVPRLFGLPNQLYLRNKINDGQLFGPTIYTTGSILDGKPAVLPFVSVIKTAEEAEKAVAKQKEMGYDFVKIYDNLTIEAYNQIISAAEKHTMPVIGHVAFNVGIDAALRNLVSIEHLTGYINYETAEFIIPENMMDHYAKRNSESGIWNCPTIVVWQKKFPVEEINERQPEIKYIPWNVKLFWKKVLIKMYENMTYRGPDYADRMLDISMKMTKALHDAGAKIILGTDSGSPFVFPGFSIHEELRLPVDAGLTPYEAIQSGTKNAAESLNRLDEFGTVSEGKRADLILIEGNPLEDVAFVNKRLGVMLRGLWLPEVQLRNMLDEFAD